MQSKCYSRLICIILITVMMVSLAVPAFANVSPAETKERMNTEFDATRSSINEYIGDISEASGTDASKDETLILWLDVLNDSFAKSNIAMDVMATPDILNNNNPSHINVKSDIFYMESERGFDFVGMTRTYRERFDVKSKIAYHLLTGRFAVNYYLNGYRSAVDYKYYNYNQDKAKNINKYDAFCGSLDFAEGKNHIFLQIAIPENEETNFYRGGFDVYRIMVGYGHVYMSRVFMMENKVLSTRVKSPYTNWESFRLTTSNLLEYDGTTLRIVEDGKERIYLTGGSLQGNEG